MAFTFTSVSGNAYFPVISILNVYWNKTIVSGPSFLTYAYVRVCTISIMKTWLVKYRNFTIITIPIIYTCTFIGNDTRLIIETASKDMIYTFVTFNFPLTYHNRFGLSIICSWMKIFICILYNYLNWTRITSLKLSIIFRYRLQSNWTFIFSTWLRFIYRSRARL